MRRTLLLLAAGALALTGCSASVGPPEVTFFGDGHTVNAEPIAHCDALLKSCDESPDAAVTLKVRRGKPVQISVPSDIGDTPWLVNVQYANAKGELQPVKQQFFTPGSKLAYTATGNAPDDQLVVVEVQQLGAAYAVDPAGNPIVDENGNPQLVVRGLWSLQVQPG
ncbi:DUF2771 family protein [Amycolatopsis thermophila]|uniref:DUF2771 family protein n=1 Tax=Amycolatopsis thermophila TaxID=206084 RepID=A0ABU0EVV1_9PSEU|nr:DUF2771 family protein [Amycolatopsis thermophila]MDQ0378937.1 hypothetical protein [Amycolatopsis thermophila]